MKKFVVLFLLLSCLYANKVDVTLRQLANIVSSQNHINILISSKIKQDNILFFLNDKSKSYVMLPAFQTILKQKDLILEKKQGFYFIDNILHPEKDNIFYTVKLNNLVYDDVKGVLDLYKIKSYYIKSTNSVAFETTFNNYHLIYRTIKSLDVKSPQIRFKINIFYTNLDDLKDRGFNLSAYMQSVDKSGTDSTTALPYTYFLNLITMPYSATSNVLSNSKKGLYATIKYLNQNGFTKINNSPILTATSHHKVSFSSVKNIPYLSSTVTNENSTKQTTQNIIYKDVGLKIDITPIVLGKDIHFDLKLVIEDLVNHTNTPTVEKRELNSSYVLKRGSVLVLSGVNKDVVLKSEYGIPVLKDIFLLGNFFKYSSKTKNKTVLTITIEAD